MIEAIVVHRLLKWARWKLKADAALGYPKQSPFMRLTPSSTAYHDPHIDSDCFVTEDAYNLMPEVYRLVIWLEFIAGIPSEDQRVRQYGKSRRTYYYDRTEAYRLLGNLMDALIAEKRGVVA